MKNNAKWWSENKLKLALVPAVIFWVVSMACFVFGLSFKNPLGVTVGNTDISILIAVALSLANTFVQIVGNDQDQSEMDWLFKFGWYASYLLGIGSNVNTLLGIVGVSNVYIEWMICLGLGTMIEVLPEKLLVQFLQSLEIPKPKSTFQNNSHGNGNKHGFPTQQVSNNFNLPKAEKVATEIPEFLRNKYRGAK